MTLKYKYTRLNVSNYEACKTFYQDVLGFNISFVDDNDQYAELDTGETKITIFNRRNLSEFVGSDRQMSYDENYAGVVLTFMVDNLEEMLKKLKSKGVELVNPPWNFPDRGFISACFRDPDGNLIELEEILVGEVIR